MKKGAGDNDAQRAALQAEEQDRQGQRSYGVCLKICVPSKRLLSVMFPINSLSFIIKTRQNNYLWGNYPTVELINP